VHDLTPGKPTADRAYRLCRGARCYFVKRVKDNERVALQLVGALAPDLSPRVVYPDLLADGVLVSAYVPGGHVRTKKLEPDLIRRFAAMQNALNDPARMAAVPAFAGRTIRTEDDGFFRDGFSRFFDTGYAKLLALRRYDLPIVVACIALADHLRAQRAAIIDTFCTMPFAWQHHDFKENNIVGSPQMLVDWGSSYGHGPFLFDLAPFLLNDAEGLAVFAVHSDIARAHGPDALARWLYAAAAIRFVGLMQWRLEPEGTNVDTRPKCAAFLTYEYRTYSTLLRGRCAPKA
jgi:hypothetical protein